MFITLRTRNWCMLTNCSCRGSCANGRRNVCTLPIFQLALRKRQLSVSSDALNLWMKGVILPACPLFKISFAQGRCLFLISCTISQALYIISILLSGLTRSKCLAVKTEAEGLVEHTMAYPGNNLTVMHISSSDVRKCCGCW